MTWIDIIEPEAAQGRLERLYKNCQGPGGQVDHILKAHSLRPRTLDGHLHLYKAVLHSRPKSLTNRECELVGVCVSKLNSCDYCDRHHTAGLARHVGDPELARRLGEASIDSPGPDDPLTVRERAMCDYATRLTLRPGEMTAAVLSPLREAGLDDGAILELNQVTAYFAYANRTVLGLGVEIGDERLGMHPDEDRHDFQHG